MFCDPQNSNNDDKTLRISLSLIIFDYFGSQLKTSRRTSMFDTDTELDFPMFSHSWLINRLVCMSTENIQALEIFLMDELLKLEQSLSRERNTGQKKQTENRGVASISRRQSVTKHDCKIR